MKITKNNYFSEVKKIGFENLPEPLKKTHLALLAKTKQGRNWYLYDTEASFREVVDLAFERLAEFIRKNKKDLSGIEERNSLLDGTYKPSEVLNGTDKLSIELQFISRFLKLTGRQVSKNELRKYIDDLQEAIQEKKIRKEDANAGEIIYIQKTLIGIYNAMGNYITIQLRPQTSERMKRIIAGPAKASKKKSRKRKKAKSVSLQGIPEDVQQKTEEQNKVMSSLDFAEMKFETLGFSQRWRELMGDPSKGFTAMVFGKPKTGKSYLCMEFAGYLARHHGDTLYVAKEEKLDATLHKKLEEKGVANPHLFVSDYLPEDLSKYDFIILDSVNKLGLAPKDLEKLRAANPGKSFIFIFQTTKQGAFRGRNEFQHDVDVVIEIPERGKAVQFGRFNQGGEMQIFDGDPSPEPENTESM